MTCRRAYICRCRKTWFVGVGRCCRRVKSYVVGVGRTDNRQMENINKIKNLHLVFKQEGNKLSVRKK